MLPDNTFISGVVEHKGYAFRLPEEYTGIYGTIPEVVVGTAPADFISFNETSAESISGIIGVTPVGIFNFCRLTDRCPAGNILSLRLRQKSVYTLLLVFGGSEDMGEITGKYWFKVANDKPSLKITQDKNIFKVTKEETVWR